ncbi:MAG: exodeoxyribonuclease VII large subunit [Tannerella sp.]|jgi:exodeoxyribonuclease VII large subunit|nr:exodeoxyribonuclease VII large subunit [Tannerella sp.]
MNFSGFEIENKAVSPKAMSLSELNYLVKEAINEALPETYWIRTETSDVRINASSGHCYLEFIEKDEKSNQITAKARATIWAQNFQIIKPYFEQETGQPFTSGIKMLVNVSVKFHELYGYSLTVNDIDPSYTLGDMLKKRNEIIERLKKEGIFDLNKELPFPTLPQRIAVITSPTAAGYEDFIHQLTANEKGFQFYIKLFPAIMQGEKTEESIIVALEQIHLHEDKFDVVVIIRGGGSGSELSSFDSYRLAAHCAQFPLPVITGIGHERDETILDLVANVRQKTPTAVASFLIECLENEADRLDELISFFTSIPDFLHNKKEKINHLSVLIGRNAELFLLSKRKSLDECCASLKHQTLDFIAENNRFIELKAQYVSLVSPENVLKRGYTLTFKNGKIVKRAEELAMDDEITIKFADGEIGAKAGRQEGTKGI